MRRVITTLLLMLCSLFSTQGQKMFFERFESKETNVEHILKKYSKNGFIPILQDVTHDLEGNIHAKYKYRKNGIYLEGCFLTLHMDELERVFLVNGTKLSGTIKKNKTELIKNEIIENTILKALNSTTFSIYDSHCRSFISNGDVDVKNYGEVVYYSNELDGLLSEKEIAFKFDVFPKNSFQSKRFYISALTGKLLYKENNTRNACEDIIVSTDFITNETITVNGDGSGNHILVDECRGIKTFLSDVNSPSPYIPSSTNNTNFANATVPEKGAVTTHYVVSQAYDYFESAHNWSGLGGDTIEAIYIQGLDNAYYEPTTGLLAFGDGEGPGNIINNSLASLEIAGHEFMHGIIHETGSFFYGQESGAVNESYADIMGLAVENFASGGFNWIVGEQSASAGGLRSFENPGLYGQPNCYNGPNYQNTGNGNPTDEFGVHTNSGVMNYWFYLLCTGQMGSNCWNPAYNYDVLPAESLAIGQGYNNSFDLMIDLLFYALENGYVGLNTEFIDMRAASIEVAHDMGFSCAFRENLKEAWAAVGVGEEPDGCGIFPDLSVHLPPVPCFGEEIFFSVTPDNNITYTYEWDFGDGIIIEAGYETSHVYLNPGTYTIIVTITDNSISDDPTVVFDQTTISILPDCDPPINNDCSVNAGVIQNLCFGVDIIHLDAPFSSAYASNPNITWTIIDIPSNIPLTDFHIINSNTYSPSIVYQGGNTLLPEGEYVFEFCVDCESSGIMTPTRKCSQSAIVNIYNEPSIPQILTGPTLNACNEIILPIIHPSIDELGSNMELEINVSPNNFISAEYIPGEGIKLERYKPSRSNYRYWRNYYNPTYSVSYYLENNGCSIESNFVTIDFVDTQYNYEDGEVDATVSKFIDDYCHGPDRVLSGSRPGEGTPQWEILSVAPNSMIPLGLISTDDNGNAIISFDESGDYLFKYSVSDPTGICPYSEKIIDFTYIELLEQPAVFNYIKEFTCETIDEELIYQISNPQENNVIYSWSNTGLAEGTYEFSNIYDPNTVITLTPGSNGTVELINGSFFAEITGIKYFIDLECNGELLTPIQFPNISLEDNATNVLNYIADVGLDFITTEGIDCIDVQSNNVEVLYNGGPQLALLVDGVYYECDEMPCIYKCISKGSFELFQGSTLFLEENVNFFCENPGGQSHEVIIKDFILNPTSPPNVTEVFDIVATDVPPNVTLPNPLTINSVITLSELGEYHFTISYSSFVDGTLACSDIGVLDITVQEPFVPFAGEDQYVCPNTLVYLNGSPTFGSIGASGTWLQTSCGADCDAIIVNPNDANTAIFFPSDACNSTYEFTWLYESVDCTPLSDNVNVFVLSDDDGCVCGGCSIAVQNSINLDWFNQLNNEISFEIVYILPIQQLQSNPILTFLNSLSDSIHYNLQGNVLTMTGVFELPQEITELCINLDFQGNEICDVDFCEEICEITDNEICPEPCFKYAHADSIIIECTTNSEGDLLYDFGFYFDISNLQSNQLIISSLWGTITNLEIVPIGFYDSYVSGTLIPNGIIPEEEICLDIDFTHPILCDMQVCKPNPNCECIINHIEIDYPECIELGNEFCIPMTFDYYGVLGQLQIEIGDNSPFVFESATNTITNNAQILLGHNEFELCFYAENCNPLNLLVFNGTIIENRTSPIKDNYLNSNVKNNWINNNLDQLAEVLAHPIFAAPIKKPTEFELCSFEEVAKLPCCENECEYELDIELNEIICQADSSGNLIYEFNFSYWALDGIPSDFILTSSEGIISNLWINNDYNVPDLIHVNGTILLSNPAVSLNFFLDFEDSILCDTEISGGIPKCDCAISNVLFDYPDCVEQNVEFCVPFTFDYYGSLDFEMNFVLNTNSPYEITSSNNFQLFLGNNEIELCFIYNGECHFETTFLDFIGNVILDNNPNIGVPPSEAQHYSPSIIDDCSIIESIEIPCCPVPCKQELDIEFYDLTCATDSLGHLLYEFDIRIWDVEGLLSTSNPLDIVALDGQVSNININLNFDPDLPELVQVTGLVSLTNASDSLFLWFDYLNPKFCDVSTNHSLPNCECVLSNTTLLYDDCITPGEEFCVIYTFDYFGPEGLFATFYVDEMNSTDGYNLISALNTETDSTEILLGSNTFEVCFVFEGGCNGDTHLFFDALIDGIDCKIWEMFDVPCCVSDPCTSLPVSDIFIGCSKTDLNGYDITIDILDPNQLGTSFNLSYDNGTVSSVTNYYVGNTLVIETLLVPNSLDETMCVNIDFTDPSICDEEVCITQPDCSCNHITNFIAEFPTECIEVGTEFCFPVTFNYSGFLSGIPFTFEMDTLQSQNYEFISYTSMGSNIDIVPGLNSFELCFTYTGACFGSSILIFDIVTDSGCYVHEEGNVNCCLPFINSYNMNTKKVNTFLNTIKINASPNPFNHSFNLEINSNKDISGNIQIFDMLGQKVFEKEISVGSGKQIVFIKPNLIEHGLYMIRFINSEGEASITNIVKTK